MVVSCTQKQEMKFPEMSPDKVVMRFYDLLGDSGKLTNKEAFQMIDGNDGGIDQNTFRKWTENFSSESKITITETKLPDKPNENGDYIAIVKMEIDTPSFFGGTFKTTSQMNLILDQAEMKWRIDFLAQTINEDDFRSASPEAKLTPVAGK